MTNASNVSIRDEKRKFTNRFHVQDNSLMSFDPQARKKNKNFQEFSAKKPEGACSLYA